ncbi:muscleblind-like [Elysia marginata]|uniref:Muscleblind-like n=1 Tax=Elysia marginata TaxID=1093978 RepID=A0AAV4IQS0_9GAST|nr:muscleblind-like [Elysia marginata]
MCTLSQCFLQGKCQRKDPPCKYLHPPQHLREQLLQNGRNNLILKNMQLQAYQQYGVLPMAGPKAVALPTATVMPAGHYPYLNPYAGLQALSALPAHAAPAGYNPYLAAPLTSVAMPTTADPTNHVAATQQLHAHPGMLSAQPKAVRADKFESPTDGAESVTSHASLLDAYSLPTYIPQVCREFQRGTCSRATSECRFAHPSDHIAVDPADNHVTVCMDYVKSKCVRDLCKYFHPPPHLQALVRAAHARNQAAAAAAAASVSASASISAAVVDCCLNGGGVTSSSPTCNNNNNAASSNNNFVNNLNNNINNNNSNNNLNNNNSNCSALVGARGECAIAVDSLIKLLV